jgi:diguanylate cyclase (GGDEF)-like protein/PAS domain S-box-containing protein
LVDDSVLSSQVISDFLKENGYHTEIIPTGESAIETVRTSTHFDLILMDIELAGEMNGIEAAGRILNSMDIPIVFFTANSSKQILDKIKEVHAYGFVIKGNDKYALLSTIEMSLNLYSANTQTKEIYYQLKQAHIELEASRKEYLELTENAPVGIIKCDVAGNIIFVNQKSIEILGSPGKEETKKINLLTFPPLVQYGFSEKLHFCLSSGENSVHEMGYESKWRKTVSVRLHVKALTDRERIIGAQIIIDDITEKKLLEEELRNLSITDPLTNIYNRRYFIQKLEEEIDRFQRQGSGSFCLAMFDIDHFKCINDTFGHHSGDLILKAMTETVKKRIRKIDCLARWGGEEFILLLPNTSKTEAQIFVDELRLWIANMNSPIDQQVTVSFGVAEYANGDTMDTLIQRVDHFMYEAKSSGRNCVRG